MDNALHALAVNRQRGLATELNTIANNIANLSTPGFRRERVLFSEFVHAARRGESVSMADTGARVADRRGGGLRVTGGALDFALEGAGYFLVEGGEAGPLLTRAGAFQRSREGLLVTAGGRAVLDDGRAPVFLPPGGEVTAAPDGTLSIDGAPIARLAVATAPPETLARAGDTAFRAEGAIEPVAEPRVRQGALEGSNVEPVVEIARMIEVSRAYEHARQLVEDEDERIRNVLRTLGQPA
jgi:flagellar basal-body rod protein FlgF